MGRNQRAPDFGRDTAFLNDDQRDHLAGEMEREGAHHSGCLLLQAPLWLLLILAAAICWLIHIAIQAKSPIVVPLFLFSCLIPVAIPAARKWVYRQYYGRPIIIGAREWVYCVYYRRPVVIGA